MGSVVEFMSGAQLGAAVDAANTLVSGMTTAEAAAALGAGKTGSGFTQITTFPLSGGNSWAPVSLEAQYAAQTWEYYKLAAEAAGITSFGAAAAAVKSYATGVLMGTGQGLAATGGLLSLSAPAAVAAAAPLLGVGIGASLYNLNPELWTKISQAILPWCYEDTDVVPAVVDENGQVSIPKGLVDALKDLFEEEGIPIGGSGTSETGTSTTPHGVVPIASSVTFTPTPAGERYGFIERTIEGEIIRQISETTYRILSKNPFTVYLPPSSEGGSGSYAEAINGGGYYYYPISYNDSYYTGTQIGINSTPTDLEVVNGTIDFPTSGDYQTGTQEWTGTIPQTLPEIWIVVDPEVDPSEPGALVPFTPIQLPEVQTPTDPSEYPVPVEDPDGPLPWESPDPEEQPDPQAPTPWPYIDPWILPEIPWQWPWDLPEPEPTIDPETGQSTDPTKAPVEDPTQRPEVTIDPERDPQTEPSPTQEPENPWDDIPPSEGSTPDIVFPPISVDPFPDLPMSDVSGLIHVYNPTPSEMQAFGRWLWVTVQDAITQGQELIWNNPFDGVISAHEIYVTPPTGAAQYIRSGFLISDVSSAVVTPRYCSINCGSIVVPEYWRNYLDYSPYTRAYCYLPFIGIVELDCDDIVGHAVNILYHIDTYSGACIAQITVAKEGPNGETYCNTNYQFSGNCAVEVPLAGGTQAAIRAAQINAAAWGLGSVISGIAQAVTNPTPGGVASGLTGAITGVMEARASVVSAKSSVQHSGSFGANFGAMGIKKPYLIIRRPIQKIVDNYNKDYGFPAHKMVQIGACTGYLRVREVNVISATANDTEKQMIELALKNGVYVS